MTDQSDTLTLEAMNKLGPTQPELFNLCNSPSLMGMKIIEEPPPPPKIQLSETAPVSEEFRTKFNLWLLARFGRGGPYLKPQEFLVSPHYGIIIAPYGKSHLLSNICA